MSPAGGGHGDALFRYLGTTPCDCGRCGRVGTERVQVTDELGRVVAHEAAGAAALLVADPQTFDACGRSLADELQTAGCDTRVLVLEPPAGAALHADRAGVERVVAELGRGRGATLPLAVGSGTLNDLVKAAAHERGLRYVAVATAPSMNGYTSSIAAITVDGLKSTLPAAPPVAVLASPAVLAASPTRMAVSGLADLLSKPVSTADWRLAHLLWDDPFCPTPARLAGRAVERAAAVAPGIRAGDPSARARLFEALLLSGISMTVAGTSSPASGGEHLISHFLDMTAAAAPTGPRRPALHGEQVGVATRVTTRLYEALVALEEPDVDWRRAEATAPTTEQVESLLARRAPWVPAALRARFVEQSARKLARLGPRARRVARVRERWDGLREVLRADARLAASYSRVLPAIDAPVTARELAVGDEELRAAYHLARFVRDRYTVLDLVGDLGLADALEPRALEGVVETPGA